ncbi:prephenate dehydratase [Acidipropionibacterium jensenii]|uniref:Prephenate dehydratase n=1 Tax=Acidipropionibacterium jensenii TaxID=1749 RepID=A0A3S4YPW5_9ACTN|nr:prephenate dehydratase [Acidipropionibacterium jensenii]MDN5977554.1 prephenate dehydratase [Acidipropionibacterium jensenii]MDN5996936.1 prephenate dehydratase [Acidipropionibacterium jensenii]MDN6426818.1 prephenate dehydratase [Acidipropionibacterium jensenii]MDN6440874.1 prephenate dehydratase [Acidipropionibacterium jensenii]MDN6480279.1 prephenate dehydratase [Acidipropionibacterium jensenii]
MLGYFGPAGTFTHQALKSLGQSDARPFSSVTTAIAAAKDGDVEASLVPIENSVEGGVSATLDTLASMGDLQILREVVIPVQFGLYVRPGTTLGQVRNVITHSHAAAQCRGWLEAHLPKEADITESGSTAGAAKEVSDPFSRYDAAICAAVAADMYRLVPAAESIADNPDAQTRFVLVGPRGHLPQRTGDDRTTVVAYMREDHSGALLDILHQFAFRGINLSRIESRPTKGRLGSYSFSIDAVGHADDERMAAALKGLHRVCEEVVFLGSYPHAVIDGEQTAGQVPTPDASTDQAYREAEIWFARVTGRQPADQINAD